MMQDVLVSVIVPVYNVEKYLCKCVDSLLAQTYKNVEIILVDDGGNDNCPHICDEYAKKDKRIKVIHKENGGLSDARNAGIDVAKGEYLCFVDSDDFVDENYVQKMVVTALENQSDLVVSNFNYIYEDGRIVANEFDIEAKKYSNNEIIYYLTRGRDVLPLIVAWSKLYSRKLFDNLKFKKAILHEDEEICHKILDLAKRISIIKDKLYYYLQRGNSIMGTTTPSKQKIIMEISKERYDYLVSKNYSEEICDLAYLSYCNYCLNIAVKFKKYNNVDEYREVMKVIKEAKKSPIFRKIKYGKKVKFLIKEYLFRLGLLGMITRIRGN